MVYLDDGSAVSGLRSKTGTEWPLRATEKLRLADFEEFLDDIRDKALVLGGI